MGPPRGRGAPAGGRGGFGRGGAGGRGGSRGGFGRGGGRGGFGSRDEGPPATVVELGTFVHPCESEMLCKSTNEKIPHFNASIYLENKQKIGKVEEILGPINEVFFTVKLDHGMNANSFQADKKFYIAPEKLLPLSRFTEDSKPSGGASRGGARGGRGGFGAPRGGSRGGFGAPRGGSRGGFGAPRGGARGSFGGARGGARGSFGGARGSFGGARGRGRGG